MKKRKDKKTRRDKHLAFLEDKFPKVKKSNVCKATKGEHVFDIAIKSRAFLGGYQAVCACGKENWKIPTLRPLYLLPKYMICEKHGYYELGGWSKREDEGCWACKLGLDPFKENQRS